jgi:hypothetical protein
MALSSLLLALVCVQVRRDRSLRDSEESPDPLRSFGVCLTFLVALGVMLLVPALTYLPLLLLVATDQVVNVMRSRLDRRAGVR